MILEAARLDVRFGQADAFLEAFAEARQHIDRYLRWREQLHHFYDPLPVVEHYGDAAGERKA